MKLWSTPVPFKLARPIVSVKTVSVQKTSAPSTATPRGVPAPLM